MISKLHASLMSKGSAVVHIPNRGARRNNLDRIVNAWVCGSDEPTLDIILWQRPAAKVGVRLLPLGGRAGKFPLALAPTIFAENNISV